MRSRSIDVFFVLAAVGVVALGVAAWQSAEGLAAEARSGRREALVQEARRIEQRAGDEIRGRIARATAFLAGENTAPQEDDLLLVVDEQGAQLLPRRAPFVTREEAIDALDEPARRALEAAMAATGNREARLRELATTTEDHACAVRAQYEFARALDGAGRPIEARLALEALRDDEASSLATAERHWVLARLVAAWSADGLDAAVERGLGRIERLVLAEGEASRGFLVAVHEDLLAASRPQATAAAAALGRVDRALARASRLPKPPPITALQAGRAMPLAVLRGAAVAVRVDDAQGRALGVVVAAHLVDDAPITALDAATLGDTDPGRLVALTEPFVGQALVLDEADHASRPFASLLPLALVVCSLIPLGLGLGLSLRALRREGRTLDARSDFLSTVAHQLKTPVANLRLFVETLASGRADDESERKRMEEILLFESEKLGDLLERVLSLARLDARARDEAAAERIDIAALLRDLEGRWRRTAPHFRLAFDLDVEPDLPPLRGDRRGLADAIDNVVDNALAHGREGTAVRVLVRRAHRCVEVRVQDRGPGIDAADRERVFDRFHRGASGRRRGEGTGLGLAIARAGAAACGGRVEIESTGPDGTTFLFTLPAAKDD